MFLVLKIFRIAVFTLIFLFPVYESSAQDSFWKEMFPSALDLKPHEPAAITFSEQTKLFGPMCEKRVAAEGLIDVLDTPLHCTFSYSDYYNGAPDSELHSDLQGIQFGIATGRASCCFGAIQRNCGEEEYFVTASLWGNLEEVPILGDLLERGGGGICTLTKYLPIGVRITANGSDINLDVMFGAVRF
jgi:hypothetical protein